MWNVILTIFLKGIGFALDRSNAKVKQKKAYLKFLEMMEKDNKSITKLRESYLSQRNAALEKVKQLKGVSK